MSDSKKPQERAKVSKKINLPKGSSALQKTGTHKLSKKAVGIIQQESIFPTKKLILNLRAQAPLVLAGGFILLAGIAFYAILSSLITYGSFGARVPASETFNLAFLAATIFGLGFVGVSVYLLHKSEVGYKYRFAALLLAVSALVLLLGLSLRHEQLERPLRGLGLPEHLRPDARPPHRSDLTIVQGIVAGSNDGQVIIKLDSGQELKLNTDTRESRVKIIPRGIKFKVGDRVEVSLDDHQNPVVLRLVR